MVNDHVYFDRVVLDVQEAFCIINHVVAFQFRSLVYSNFNFTVLHLVLTNDVVEDNET